MNENEIMNMWKSYDQKLEQSLSLNKKLTVEVTRLRVKDQIAKTGSTKKLMLLTGIPYTILLYCLAITGYIAGGVFFTIGFGAIAFIMTAVVIAYFYHLYLINKIDNSETISAVQENLSRLKISTFKITRLALLQIPFWSLCWISTNALRNSLAIYGSVNLVVILGLCWLTFFLIKNMDPDKMDRKLNRFLFSGMEWDPIIKSKSILDQLNDYKVEE